MTRQRHMRGSRTPGAQVLPDNVGFRPGYVATLPTAGVAYEGVTLRTVNGLNVCQPLGGGAYSWVHIEAGSTITTRQVNFTLGDGVSVIPAGTHGYLPIPFAATITDWTLFADVSGSLVLDIWKDTYANAPPTAADTITASAKPSLSAAQKATSNILTGWSTTVADGDVLAFNVDSATTIKQLTVSLGLLAGANESSLITFVIGDGGSVITTGFKGFLPVTYNATITDWTVIGDSSGSIVLDLWKDTYANAPPVVVDTITAAAKPTLSAAQKATSSTLTGWTTTITDGDVIGINVDSVATVKRVTLALGILR